MQLIRSSRAVTGARRAWERPAVTKLAIGTETKLARENKQGVGLEASGQPRLAHPRPPAAPATKFGFSIEMSFPLSARIEE
jgi:hypothetical protein